MCVGGGVRGSQSDVCVDVCDQLAVGVEEERIKKDKRKVFKGGGGGSGRGEM